MEEKTKFIIILLAGVLSISLFINFQTYTAKKIVERDRDSLQRETESLNKKIYEIVKNNKQLKDKVNSLNSDLERISEEKQQIQNQREEIQRQFELITKERDQLLEKLKTHPEIKGGEVSSETEAYWGEILKKKTELSLQVENMRSELKKMQTNNEQLQRDLSTATGEKEELEQELSYKQKMFDNMLSEFVIEKSMKRRLQDDLRLLKKDNVLLKRQLKSLSKRRVYLENKLVKLQEEKSTLQRRFNEMSLMVEEIYDIAEIEDTSSGMVETLKPEKESIELPPIVVHSQPGLSSPEDSSRGLWGSILEINKENNFVIIDLGQGSGIKLGDTLQVYRQDKVIATIEVVGVRKGVAACDIKKEIIPIKIGDTIR